MYPDDFDISGILKLNLNYSNPRPPERNNADASTATAAMVFADPDMIRLALRNLISNAYAEFTHAW